MHEQQPDTNVAQIACLPWVVPGPPPLRITRFNKPPSIHPVVLGKTGKGHHVTHGGLPDASSDHPGTHDFARTAERLVDAPWNRRTMMVTIPLAQREVTNPPAPAAARRWWQRPPLPEAPGTEWETMTFSLGPAYVAPILLLGMDGSGKNQASVWWMWRLLQAGAQVISIGGRYADNAELATVALAAGYPVATYAATEPLTCHSTAAAFTRITFGSVPDTDNGVTRGALVGQKIREITAQRLHIRQPLVVVLDGAAALRQLPDDQLASILTDWPALNIHLLYVGHSAEELLDTRLPAIRALWSAARMRCFFRDHTIGRADRPIALARLGLDAQHSGLVAFLLRGEVVVQTGGDGGQLAQVTPCDVHEYQQLPVRQDTPLPTMGATHH